MKYDIQKYTVLGMLSATIKEYKNRFHWKT